MGNTNVCCPIPWDVSHRNDIPMDKPGNTVTWRPARGARQHRAPVTPPKAFHKEPGHIHSRGRQNMCISLWQSACYQNFSKICWRVEICSVILRARRQPHWVCATFASISSPYLFLTNLALFLGGRAKRYPGSWCIHSCFPCAWVWSICQSFGAFPNRYDTWHQRCSWAGMRGNGVPKPFPCFDLNEFEAIFKWLVFWVRSHTFFLSTTSLLDTHESAQPPGVLSSPNSLSNFCNHLQARTVVLKLFEIAYHLMLF